MRKNKMIFYHGTSTNIKINNILLPPSETGLLREDFRKNLRDKVFVTISKPSAIRYAKRAVEQFGGEAIIYIVKPDRESLIKRGTEYLCDAAFIKSFEKY